MRGVRLELKRKRKRFVESVQVLWCRLRRVKDCEKELHSQNSV